MFDKINLTSIINIEDSVFQSIKKHNTDCIEIYVNLDTETGEVQKMYVVRDEKIPYIKYNDRTKLLYLSLSIPKLIYGNNLQEINEEF